MASCGGVPEFELAVAVTIIGGALEASVPGEQVTEEMQIVLRKDEIQNPIKLTVFYLGAILCRLPVFLKLLDNRV